MIIYILRILFFWLSINGYFLFANRKLKIEKTFVMPIVIISIMIILFIASILNMLLIFSIILLCGGIFCYAYLDHYHMLTKEYLKSYFDYKYIIIAILIIIFTIICMNLHITEYYNFSHWALSVKNLFMYNSLGSFKYDVDLFTSYPPATALFTYYFGIIASRSETSMLIGQVILNMAFLTPIMIFFNDNKKVLSSITFILLTIVFMVINIPINSLLVDSILGFMAIMSIIISYYYQNDLKKCFMYLTLISIAFLLTKNSGILFIVFNVILLLIVGKKNRNIKKGLIYTTYMLLIVIFFFVIWQSHLLMVYPSNYGVNTKHSISIVNVGRNVLGKGIGQSIEILKVYVKEFLNFNSIIVKYWLGINAIMIGMVLFYKKNRPLIAKSILLMNVLYLGYYLCLGIMYIVSMPYNEAIKLACYSRYMLTIIIVLIGILVLNFYHNLKTNNHFNNYFFFVIVLGSLYIICNNNNKEFLLGNDQYMASGIYEVREIKKDLSLSEYKNNNKIFYLKPDRGICTFYRFALRYEYMDSKISVYCENLDINTFKDEDLLILPNEAYHPFREIPRDEFYRISKNIYQKNKN